jgi:hypothetical protein
MLCSRLVGGKRISRIEWHIGEQLRSDWRRRNHWMMPLGATCCTLTEKTNKMPEWGLY